MRWPQRAGRHQRHPGPPDYVLLHPTGGDLDRAREAAAREATVRDHPELAQAEHVRAALVLGVDFGAQAANRRLEQQAPEPASP